MKESKDNTEHKQKNVKPQKNTCAVTRGESQKEWEVSEKSPPPVNNPISQFCLIAQVRLGKRILESIFTSKP